MVTAELAERTPLIQAQATTAPEEVTTSDTVAYEKMALPILFPFGVKIPAGMTAGQAQIARISLRPPKIHFAVDKLPEASQRALAKARGVTLAEAIDLFFDLQNLGYQNDFARPQKGTAPPARNSRRKFQ